MLTLALTRFWNFGITARGFTCQGIVQVAGLDPPIKRLSRGLRLGRGQNLTYCVILCDTRMQDRMWWSIDLQIEIEAGFICIAQAAQPSLQVSRLRIVGYGSIAADGLSG